MKKFMFTFVVLFALALVAAQCGQPQVIEKEVVVTKEVEVEKVVTVEVEKQVEVMVTPTPEPTGPVKLVFWSFLDQEYPNMYPFFQEKLAGFQEMHPDVEIEFVPIPYEGSDAKYLAAFAGRENAPDMWMGKVPYFAGGLKVADPAPEDIQQAWEDILVENIKPYLQWEGDYYGFPIESDLGVMLYYNTDMYQEAGLDPAQPPKTMDELLANAQKLTDAGYIGFGVRYAGNPRGIADKWLPFLHAWCGQLYSDDGTTSDGYLNSPQAIESLQFYGDLVNKYGVSSLTVGAPMDAFARGQVGQFFREAWTVGVLRDSAPDLKYAVSPIPEAGCNPGLSLLFQTAIMVNKFSPNKDMAWEWMRYMTLNPEFDLEMAKINGTLPVHKANFDDEYVSTRPDYDSEQEIRQNPASPYYGAPFINEIAFRVGQAVEEVLFGQKTAEQALNDAVPDVDELLNK
jgi:multiple sugar transport system substrate-binding protein